MRLWPRRKVIYTWDDNFAPACDFIPGPIVSPNFVWSCPDNLYIRVTSVFGRWTAVAGIRPSLIIEFHIHRAQHLRFAITIMSGLITPRTLAFVLTPAGSRFATTFSSIVSQNVLPLPSHLIPGDRIEIHNDTTIANDFYSDLCISYDKWELA